MAAHVRRVPLDGALAAAVAVLIVLLAFGSSSVTQVRRVGTDGRWVALLLLGALGAVELWRVRASVRLTYVHALAAALAALALLSAAWSVAPRTTVERGVTFAFLLAVACELGATVAARPQLTAHILRGVAAGILVVLVAGLLVLAASSDDAVQHATEQTPARFRGVGENPNTVALLAGVGASTLLWAALSSTGRRRVFWFSGLALLWGTIAASGSRGGLVAGAVSCAAVTLLRGVSLRRAVLGTSGVLAAAVLAAAVAQLPNPSTSDSAATTPTAAIGPLGPVSTDLTGPNFVALPPAALGACRQEDQVGRPAPGQTTAPVRRTLFGSSGRAQAWREALDQARERPVAGYGFGTEDRVFFNCFYVFQGARPENSLIGMTLQLGAAGLVTLLVLVVAVAIALGLALRARRGLLRASAAALAGVTAGGLAVSLVQSYVYSAGNIAAAVFWVCAFAGAGLATRRAGDVALG